jgi:glycosyltransferase involved in cell wall biosynthesis
VDERQQAPVMPAENPALLERPRVLIVGPLPPPLGGVQLMIEMQRRSCLAREFQLSVTDTSKRQLRWAVENPTWRTPAYFVRDFVRLVRDLLRIRPRAVIVHAAPSLSFIRDWVFMITARLSHAKVICHYHGTLHTNFPSCLTPRGRRIGRLLMRAAHRIIVLGPTYQREMGAAWGRDDIEWAPNVVDLDSLSLSEPHPPSRLAPDELGVIFVGRLSEPKGIWDLLDAVPMVISRAPQVRFILVGVAEDVAKEKILRDEVKRRNLSEYVVFLGSLEGKEKARAYLSASLIVVPSWTEAFPLVIPEAMAAGLPIVATAVGAIPDFITDGEDGFLIPPRNPSILAARIIQLVEDAELRNKISARVRTRSAREFAIDVGCARVAGVVKEVLEREARCVRASRG